MKYRLTFTVPPGVSREVAAILVHGQTYEAELYERDAQGWCRFMRRADISAAQDGSMWVNELVIEFGPGVVRSIMPVVGAAAESQEAADEDPRRTQATRPKQAARFLHRSD